MDARVNRIQVIYINQSCVCVCLFLVPLKEQIINTLGIGGHK